MLRRADAIAREELTEAGLDRDIWQCPVVLLADVRSVGVQGDGRTYGHPVVLRPVASEDAMTADWARVPYDVLATISTRITNEVERSTGSRSTSRASRPAPSSGSDPPETPTVRRSRRPAGARTRLTWLDPGWMRTGAGRCLPADGEGGGGVPGGEDESFTHLAVVAERNPRGSRVRPRGGGRCFPCRVRCSRRSRRCHEADGARLRLGRWRRTKRASDGIDVGHLGVSADQEADRAALPV